MDIQAPKALVIDDEGMVSMLIEDILADRGYDVTVVNTRAQLQEALKLDCWTLAVTDTDLATFDEMQHWNVDRVVLCTGKTEAVIREEFPFMPFVLKPCCAEDFDKILGDRHGRTNSDTSSSGASA